MEIDKNILNEINNFIAVDLDEKLFNQSMDFIFSLDVDILTDEQLDALQLIIDELSASENIDELKRAKKSLAVRKQYGRAFWRKNKIRLKAKKKKIAASADGRKRARAKERMAKANRTPSGRKKILYNTIGHVN